MKLTPFLDNLLNVGEEKICRCIVVASARLAS
jgi:hypothetical protein